MNNVPTLSPATHLSSSEDVSVFLSIVPTDSKESVLEKAKAKAKAVIFEENNLYYPEELAARLKKQHPILPDKAQIAFIARNQRHYQGMIIYRNPKLVSIGGQKVIREDIPMDFRMQIWQEDRDAMIDKSVREQMSTNLVVIKKNMDTKLGTILPPMLLSAGYIPNFNASGVTTHSINLDHWITRPVLLQQSKNQIKSTHIKKFWQEKGYRQISTPSGMEWLPKSFQ